MGVIHRDKWPRNAQDRSTRPLLRHWPLLATEGLNGGGPLYENMQEKDTVKVWLKCRFEFLGTVSCKFLLKKQHKPQWQAGRPRRPHLWSDLIPQQYGRSRRIDH